MSRVIIVTLDTTRADRLGCYGHELADTPNLDALAAQAALFENAMSPAPTTLPAHSTLFTGYYPQDHGVRYNLIYRLGPDAITLAETLREAGFATGGFPASYIVASRFGLDQGFETYPDPPGGPGQMDHPQAVGGLRAGEVTDRALEWIDAQGDEARLFAWVHFYDAHAPYEPPFPYSDTYRDRPYDGELAYADAQFGRLLEHLRTSPHWDETLLIVVGDHGEGLHEHRERFHANLVYQSTVDVPLIVRAPRGSPRRVEEPVGLVDIMPTVLDFAGLPSSRASRGTSLRPAIEGRRIGQREIYFETLAGALNYGWSELKGVRWGSWKLIDSDEPELFDLAEDPHETDNLAGREADRVEQLRELLGVLAEPSDDEQRTAEQAYDAVLDAETEAFLASLGYVGSGAGSSAQGAKHPRHVIDLEPELLAAQMAIVDRDWAALEDVCRYVLERDPKNKFGLNNLVSALLATGREAEAEEFAAAYLDYYPESERGYTLLAQVLKTLADTMRAYEVLVRGLDVIPDSEALRYLSIVAAFDLELHDVCSERVPAAVEQHERSGRMRVLRARCQLTDGDPQAVVATLREAADLGFRDFEALEQSEVFETIVELPAYTQLVESLRPQPSEPPETAYIY